MEFVEGQVLTSVIPANVGLPFDLVVQYGIEIADAVSHAHKHDVIHRDLEKRQCDGQSRGSHKVAGFWPFKDTTPHRGSQFPSDADTKESSDTIVGTPPYWAPEILKHRPSDSRSDIWSFGVLLYEMSSGQMPFKGATMIELGSAILHGPPLPLPEQVPESLSKITYRCLRKQMGQRYQHAGEILAALEAIEQGSMRRFQRHAMVSAGPTLRSGP